MEMWPKSETVTVATISTLINYNDSSVCQSVE